MMVVTTQNSVYELDDEQARVRRVSGKNPPTPYFGEDGVWQPVQAWRFDERQNLTVWWSDTKFTQLSNTVSVDRRVTAL